METNSVDGKVAGKMNTPSSHHGPEWILFQLISLVYLTCKLWTSSQSFSIVTLVFVRL